MATIVAISAASGAAAQIPKAIIPNPLAPQIFSPATTADQFLQCVATSLRGVQDKRLSLALGDLRTRLLASGGADVPLPFDIASNVRKALGSMPYVIDLIETSPAQEVLLPMGFPGASVSSYSTSNPKARPDYILEGAIVAAQFAKDIRVEADLQWAGGSKRAKAYDVEMELRLVRLADQRQVTPPVLVIVRMYEAENGAQLIVTYTEGYSRVAANAVRAAPVIYAVQLGVTYAIAALFQDVASTLWGLPVSTCPARRIWRAATPTDGAAPSPARFQIYRNSDGNFCADLGALTFNQPVTVLARQFDLALSEIGPSSVERSVRIDQGYNLCLPTAQKGIDAARVEMEVWNEDEDRLVAVGSY